MCSRFLVMRMYKLIPCQAVAPEAICDYNVEFAEAGEECAVLWEADEIGLDAWLEKITADDHSVYFAFVEGHKIAGLCRVTLYPNHRASGVIGYGLRPSMRRKGLAPRMIGLLCSYCIDHGVDHPTACVEIGNVRSEAALKKAGFAPTGVEYDWIGGRRAREFMLE